MKQRLEDQVKYGSKVRLTVEGCLDGREGNWLVFRDGTGFLHQLWPGTTSIKVEPIVPAYEEGAYYLGGLGGVYKRVKGGWLYVPTGTRYPDGDLINTEWRKLVPEKAA